MIIIDDFVKDSDLLASLRREADLMYGKDYYWKDRESEPFNTTEQFCELVFNNYYRNKDYSGFEYWVNYLTPEGQSDLPWHYDKDEFHWRETGSIICPTFGMVYYLHEEVPVGGWLEIKWGEELERIRAVPNRLVIFDPSVFHRVSKVESARHTLAANVWVDKSSPENFDPEKVQLHK